MGISDKRIGVFFREYGFLPHRISSSCRPVLLGSESVELRKGRYVYAEKLVRSIGSEDCGRFSNILVVGDGVGDWRFLENLGRVLQPTSFSGDLAGHFLNHSELLVPRLETENSNLHSSWAALAEGISGDLATSKAPLLLIDIDRTVLFPRKECDDSYLSLRKQVVVKYVAHFSRFALGRFEIQKIGSFIDFVANSFGDYNNELESRCFKNEEVVASVALLMSLGVLRERVVRGIPRVQSLFDLISSSIRSLQHGGWISGLYDGSEDQKKLVGQDAWREEACVEHLKDICVRLDSDMPVLNPVFRSFEAELLEDILCDNSNAWNKTLLDTVLNGSDATILFLTDRPAETLGANSRPDGAGTKGFIHKVISARRL